MIAGLSLYVLRNKSTPWILRLIVGGRKTANEPVAKIAVNVKAGMTLAELGHLHETPLPSETIRRELDIKDNLSYFGPSSKDKHSLRWRYRC
ncbi:MAG: hypothetical protein WD070_12695 [Pirellulaceae bacterium]